jgi:hypothetical protein
MLERIALHQTRLRTPGLGLDAKGVALGAKGLVLLPTLDRLVAWLAVFTYERSLEDLLPGLEIHRVRSKLGTREITLRFNAESSDRMDRVAETARLVGGFTFTGTSRHFVQYRDLNAPFGYDTSQLLSAETHLALYHEQFSQAYDEEAAIGLRSLLLRLMPRAEPATLGATGPRYVVAERGLGPSLVHYLIRSRVEAEVCIGEWPGASAFEDETVQRYIFRIAELPPRMRALTTKTPGIWTFLPVAAGVAVEIGYRHAVALRACPVFDPNGLVLFRGASPEGPWSVLRLPKMADIRAFAKIEFSGPTVVVEARPELEELVRIGLRLAPSQVRRTASATCVPKSQLPLLRKLAYALPHATLSRTTIALTDRGAFLRFADATEGLPLGHPFVEVQPWLYVAAGHELLPAVSPDALAAALRPEAGRILFIGASGNALSLDESHFVLLESALLQGITVHDVPGEALETPLDQPLTLSLRDLGLLPMRDAKALPEEEPSG